MRLAKKIVLILAALILLVLLSAMAGTWYISHRALPNYNKDVKITGLHHPVEVYRDEFAIPHVYASDEHDLYLVTGYLLAQDRLWQMDLLRRLTEGRLSEIFGNEYVNTDLLLRALRFSRKSEEIIENTDSLSLLSINAFADGINQFIKNAGGKLPPEFTLLRYRPEEWKAFQTVNLIGYMAWDLKAGWSEILLSEIAKTIDSVRYRQLLPIFSEGQSTVYSLKLAGNPEMIPEKLLNSAALAPIGGDILDGSNNWAVSGSKSVSGMPLLANDMHLGLNIPGIWYQMHQVIEGKLNVSGLILPGSPFIICGHNDSIAWGMTNTYVDNLDFYEEEINPAHSDEYKYQGEWHHFTEVPVTVNTGKEGIVEKVLKFSHRGPVVSDFKKIKNKVVTMHWVGDEKSDEIQAVRLLNYANNWSDFRNALRTFSTISQNIAYADKKGNIGLYCAAGVPIRKRSLPGEILPGSTDEYDWKGYIPFDELPYLYNPENGFVVSANNRTIPTGYAYHIGTWYSLPYRYNRIKELLEQKEKLGVEDFKVIQLDQNSLLAKKYSVPLLSALKMIENPNTVEKEAIDMLNAWDFSMDKSKAEATIFESFYLQFLKCTFSDELTPALFKRFQSVTSVSRTAADQIISEQNSPWFDNVSTGNIYEGMNEVLICAFRQAIQEISDSLGENPRQWIWGNNHNLTLEHPLSKVKVLDRIFRLNRGPYPAGGSFHTVSPFSYDDNDPFKVVHGSSHRHIYDLSNWDNSFTVIPTGNSGIPSSRHYCDQTDMYMNGQYHKDWFSKEKIVAHAKYHCFFK